MVITGDPHADFDAWDRKRETALEKLPKCENCGEPIQEECLYDIDGELYCDECIGEVVKEKFRKRTEEYIEED